MVLKIPRLFLMQENRSQVCNKRPRSKQICVFLILLVPRCKIDKALRESLFPLSFVAKCEYLINRKLEM